MKNPAWAIVSAAAAAVVAMMSGRGGGGRGGGSNGGGEPPDGLPPHGPDIPRLTPEAVALYAFNGCTDQDIADRFIVDPQQIRHDHTNLLRSVRALRRFNVRKAQTDLALGKNNPMLTWIGRNELGQSLNPAARGRPEPEVDGDSFIVDGS
jgi:hypothetical protein